MKPLLLTFVLGVLGAGPIIAQDAEKPETDTEPSEQETVEKTELSSSKEFVESIEESGLVYEQLTTPDASRAGLKIDTRVPLESPHTNSLTAIELPRVRLEGTLTPVIKKRTFGSFLQLFNPFAPAEYGGSAEPFTGRAESRAFHDQVTDRPATVLFGVGGKPKKPGKD